MDAEAVEILREIRDEVRRTNEEVRRTNEKADRTNEKADRTNAALQQTNAELQQANARLGAVETTLLDLAQQQRFVVRHLKGLAERDHRFERELDDLRARVDRIEERLEPE
jgi:chromosome segregation ATPase